jgi:hypothetical protein
MDRLTEGRFDMRVDESRAGLRIWRGSDLVELHGVTIPCSTAERWLC